MEQSYFYSRAFLLFALAHERTLPIAKKWEVIDYVTENRVTDYQELVRAYLNEPKTQESLTTFFESWDEKVGKVQLNIWQMKWLSFDDERYPEMLRHIYEPPLGLFIIGDESLLAEPSISIVGSRENSQYGRNVVERFVPGLVEAGYVIVSGLAKGIDGISHQETIASKGKTIAVIGTGMGMAYPSFHQALQAEIGKHHCLVSEYPATVGIRRHHFPMRNRIIAGLSLGTVVVEAEIPSGSLITANVALKEGREVFAVPGSIFSKLSRGTNDIIKHGAKCVLNTNDILEDLPQHQFF